LHAVQNLAVTLFLTAALLTDRGLAQTVSQVVPRSVPRAYNPATLSPDQVATDMALLRRALEQVHAGYDRYVPRRIMDTVFAKLGRRALAPMTELELYREVALVLAKIRCSHTKAEYPRALEQLREQAATHLPVQVRVFGMRLFVARSADSRVARGAEILRINGIAAAEIITKLARFTAVDGFTDFSRSALLERDADLMGSDLDHYWPVEFGFATAWRIETRTGSAIRTVTIPPITFSAWKAVAGESAPIDFANGTQWSMIDDTTALLSIRSFVNYRRPVDADSLYRSIFVQLHARGAKHLIIDLRGNGGGSDDASVSLIRFLAVAPVQPVRRVRRRTIQIDSALASAFDTWGDRAPIFSPAESLFVKDADGWFSEGLRNATLPAAEDVFTGKVSVLVGRRNGSGATMLLAVLQQLGAKTGRLRLVGEETGGSAEGPTAGQILFLRLPSSGIRVRIPLKRSDVNVTSFVPGMGLFPDVDATESLADFRAGVDRALLTARTMPWRAPASPVAPTIGLMRGALEYRDYQSGKQVLLPTWLHTAPIGMSGAFRLRTIYDDGPGNTIYSTDVLRISGDRWIESDGTGDGETASRASTLRIVSRSAVGGNQRIVLRGSGMDDNKRVEFRYTMTLGDTVQTRLKEFRLPGKSWEYRHEYRFRRVLP
jgi:hypothetical protein